MKKQKYHYNTMVVVLLGIALLFLLLVFAVYSEDDKLLNYSDGKMVSNTEDSDYVDYASEDLKIQLSYPKGWYVDDRYHSILLTSYETDQNKNEDPSSGDIEFYIRNFNAGCHESIEENLRDPACGEGGPSVPQNEIVSKEVTDVPAGLFYTYVVKYPTTGEETVFYLLESEDRVLQISKQPDPSEHDEVFMKIVQSIDFFD